MHKMETALGNPSNLALFATAISVFTLFVNAYTFWIVFHMARQMPAQMLYYADLYDRAKEDARKPRPREASAGPSASLPEERAQNAEEGRREEDRAKGVGQRNA